MILSLTARLIALPELAWPRLVAACDADEPLPSPIAHASVVAVASVLMTVIGGAIEPGRTVGGVAVHGLTAIVGYVGASVLAPILGSKLLPAPAETQHLRGRYASAAVLPIAVCGVMNIVPLTGLSLFWALAAAGLTARSGWLGASSMLGLEGPDRKRATVTVTLLGALPVLVATIFRIVLTR